MLGCGGRGEGGRIIVPELEPDSEQRRGVQAIAHLALVHELRVF